MGGRPCVGVDMGGGWKTLCRGGPGRWVEDPV